MGQKHNEPRGIPIAFEDSSDEEELNADQPLDADESGAEPEVPAQATAGDSGVSGDPPSVADDVDADSSLQAQIDALAREKVALYDQLLRRAAEFENYRRRIERERADAYQRARVEVLLEFLPVVDNFERALSSLEDSGGDAEALRHGVELIHKQFKDALTKFGLEPVDAIGQTFDPHLHEAVTIEATDKHKENTVIEEFQRGYKIGDRLLRPAKVKVAAIPK
ncbi:MAG TPA: nucleotide exchange factor GrpE [Blastocatellia bacterium]|nr:nucleotide exchange factor GrpE [Blastocatellia bacterium]